VELVVREPKHPYTQLLINSVPQPNPRHQWGAVEVGSEGAAYVRHSNCTFADRCPYVMDQCRQSPPPLYRVDPARAAACFLYRESAESLPLEQLSEVMATTGSVPQT